MNYIYDIVLNFQDNYYQFFEWNRKDKIKNISRIAVYHISDQDLIDLTYNQIILSLPFLSQLKNEIKKYKKIMCLVSNTSQTIGLLFNQDGRLIKRSSLLFEEETEVNNIAKTLPITEITYQENIKVDPNHNLRIEIEKKDTLVQYINQTKDIIALKYLYYEYFKEECDDYHQIKTALLNILEEEWNKKKNNLYYLINILAKKDLLTK
ncbi:MAG: hypothetical protein IJ509_04075 [Bacilli bacterium]|nr:hypothetical protein [Bacilli bacterium]